jgi:hypothetical protein
MFRAISTLRLMNSNSEFVATPLAATIPKPVCIDIFGFEIEAQFGFLSVRANKKSQEIPGRVWLQCGQPTPFDPPFCQD